ncbi:MAG: energy-coupling factor ABC transporter permease [candidate division FCPU426 bacterium]
MHIAEGILTGKSMAVTTVAGLAVLAWGTKGMARFVSEQPERKPLLGMAGAFIFIVSLIPIPAFTGTTSHPCGTPLAGILLGPSIAAALAFLSLLLQASFFAHGGFSSLGANTLTLGLAGAGSAWLAFKLGRKLGMPLWAAAGLAGLLGDVITYAAAGLMLGTHLAFFAPEPKYGLGGYLSVIYAAYLPTQGPIAIGEMLLTGYAIHSIAKQRPEVLKNLGVDGGKFKGALLILALGLSGLGAVVQAGEMKQAVTASAPAAVVSPVSAPATTGFPGMDEAVNEAIAHQAGAHTKDPFINLEAMGDVWNFVLLLGGGLAGFVIGRNWNQLFGKKKKD